MKSGRAANIGTVYLTLASCVAMFCNTNQASAAPITFSSPAGTYSLLAGSYWQDEFAEESDDSEQELSQVFDAPFDSSNSFQASTLAGAASLTSTVHVALSPGGASLFSNWIRTGSITIDAINSSALAYSFTLTEPAHYRLASGSYAGESFSHTYFVGLGVGNLFKHEHGSTEFGGTIGSDIVEGSPSGTLQPGFYELRETATGDFNMSTQLRVNTGFVWNKATGGSFSQPSNWLNNQVPGETHKTVFDLDETYTVTVSGPSVQNVQVYGGSVKFDGKLTSEFGLVDGFLSSPATVRLSGSNSKWLVTDQGTDPRTLLIGNTGNGVVSLADGAVLDSTRVRMGQDAGSKGKVTVDGALFQALEIRVGELGDGTIEVTNGGELKILNGGLLLIGDLASSTSKVTIRGAASKLTASDAGFVGVGNHGHGILDIVDGAQADIPGLIIGGAIGDFNHPGNGKVTIDGLGTMVTSEGWTIGAAPVGQGQVTLSGGAIAEVGLVGAGQAAGQLVVGNVNSFGILNVIGLGTQLRTNELCVGSSPDSAFPLNAGTGLILIDHSVVEAYFFDIGPTSQIKLIHGMLSAAGGNIKPGGAILGTGSLVISDQASLTNGGLIAPGLSPGVLTIEGNYVQIGTGALGIEIGGLEGGTQYDQLIVHGDATLDGTLDLMFINGFAPHQGDQFAFLNVTGDKVGAFADVQIEHLAPGFQYSVANDGNAFILTALNDGVFLSVPEPATLWMLLFAAASWCPLRRRNA